MTPAADVGGSSERQPMGDLLWVQSGPGTMTFTGELFLLAEPFRDAVSAEARRQGGTLLLDLTALEFMDSGGLGALYALCRDPELQLSLRVLAGSKIDRILQVSAMENALPIERIGGDDPAPQ